MGSTWPKAHSVSLFVDCTLLMLPEFFRHCHFFYRSMVLPPTIIVIEGAVFWNIMKTTSYCSEWPSSSEVGCVLIERHFILFRRLGGRPLFNGHLFRNNSAIKCPRIFFVSKANALLLHLLIKQCSTSLSLFYN